MSKRSERVSREGHVRIVFLYLPCFRPDDLLDRAHRDAKAARGFVHTGLNGSLGKPE